MVRGLGDGAHVFIGAGRFLSDAAHGAAANQNTLVRQFLNHLTAAPLAQRLMPAHAPSGAMTGGTECELHAFPCACQNIGSGAHGAADENWLTDFLKSLRDVGMAGTKGAGGAFAMDK